MTADFLYLECDAKACRASDSQVVIQSHGFLSFNIQIPSRCDFCMKQTPEDGEIMGCDYTTLTATTETATCFIAKYRPNYTEYSDGMPLWALQLLKSIH